MFSISFLVLKEEADFLAEELRQQIPNNPGDNPLVISIGQGYQGGLSLSSRPLHSR
jgi:hypothetical protein